MRNFLFVCFKESPQVGWGFEQPCLVEDALGRGIGLDDL